ncbi:MAG TPA: hypothetical protein ENJ12_01620 [Thiolapillus brandeum]|uniref:Cytochrome c-552/4 domain-containing protein n=1 Tax=Thiolapillus brandeum TaxID=1076588 RepID=A0A831WEF2_9GAMM|nr:hypothetical protein [Thiolapillus brandeum]
MKGSICGRGYGLVRVISAVIILLAISAPVFSAKVTLSPDNWGLEEGRACIDCHEKSSPGLTHQWRESAHADANVNCLDCHHADAVDDDAMEHEGSIIATIVSPRDCARCHEAEYRESEGSVHSKALVKLEKKFPNLNDRVFGEEMTAAGCTQCHGSKIRVKGDGTLDPDTWPNSGIGRINPDGSRGSCSACHGRHGFSKAQARTPAACIRCHSGPESPDGEVYNSSQHGIMYSAHRDKMNLDSDEWVTGKDYSAAPTCVTCHMGAAPGLNATHDVGMRDAWRLNGPVSEKQYLVIFQDGDRRDLPASHAAPRRGTQLSRLDGSVGKVKAVATPGRRRKAMRRVCLECHSKGFAKGFMRQFDTVVKRYNEKYGKPAQAIMNALYEKKVLSPAPFDEPLEFSYWRLWHDEGTRARHGAAMGSPNSTWWEGMHLVAQNFYGTFLPLVRKTAGEELGNALIDQFVSGQDHHSWLRKSTQSNPGLGYGIGIPGDE